MDDPARFSSRWPTFGRMGAMLVIVVLAVWAGWALGFSMWHAREDGWSQPDELNVRLVFGWFTWAMGLVIVAGLALAAARSATFERAFLLFVSAFSVWLVWFVGVGVVVWGAI